MRINVQIEFDVEVDPATIQAHILGEVSARGVYHAETGERSQDGIELAFVSDPAHAFDHYLRTAAMDAIDRLPSAELVYAGGGRVRGFEGLGNLDELDQCQREVLFTALDAMQKFDSDHINGHNLANLTRLPIETVHEVVRSLDRWLETTEPAEGHVEVRRRS